MKNSTKITAALVIVLLIVAIVYGVRHGSTSRTSVPAPDTTTAATTTVSQTVSQPSATTSKPLAARPGWKRYSDAEYGYTFEYPSAWNIETAFVKTDTGMTHIVSVASDVSRKLPIPERQEIVSIKVAPAATTNIGGSVEYSASRTGFVSTTNAGACVSPSYQVGAAAVDTKIPFYQLLRAHTGDGTRTEDAVLTNKETLVQVSNVSSYPGNTDIVGVLSSFGFTEAVKAVVPTCKSGTASAPANQNLIIQVTSPVSGTIWDSNMTHVVTWRTGSSPVKGNVGLYLVNRVNRRECLIATAAAQAQSQTINITAGQTCAQGGGLTLAAGDYDFYIRYPQNLIDPFATSTGAFYANPANQPIHIEIAEQ